MDDELRVHAANLIIALKVAIDARSPIDRAELRGGLSGLVQGWQETMEHLESGKPLEILPFDRRTSRLW